MSNRYKRQGSPTTSTLRSPATPAKVPMTKSSITIFEIARVCHEVNSAYCEALGDTIHVAWEDAPDWLRDSAVAGVTMHLANPAVSLEKLHESWMARKVVELPREHQAKVTAGSIPTMDATRCASKTITGPASGTPTGSAST